MTIHKSFLVVASILAFTTAAYSAEWYQSYEKGYKAVEKGKCDEGVPLLKDAVSKQPKPDLKARPYGLMTWEYIPHYYLAKCAVAAGDFAAASEYIKQAEQIDMFSSSKSNDFRTMKNTVEQKIAGGSKPPVNNTGNPVNNTGTTTTGTNNTGSTKPPINPTGNTKPPVNNIPNANLDKQAAVDRALNDAKMAFAQGDYDSARNSADRVLALDHNNVDATLLRAQIDKRDKAEQDSRIKKDRVGEARRALARNDFSTAESIAIDLKSKYPGDGTIASLASEIATAKAARDNSMKEDDRKAELERQVIVAFYSGNYVAVVQLADTGSEKHPDSWRLPFFEGCAYTAMSLLEEKNHDSNLTQARTAFKKAKSITANIPQLPQISPKIWDVFKSS